MVDFLLFSSNFDAWCFLNAIILLLIHFCLTHTIGLLSKKICTFFLFLMAIALIVRAWSNFEGIELIIQSLFTIVIAILINQIKSYSILPIWAYLIGVIGISIFFFYQWYIWDIKTYECRSPICEPKEKVICTTSVKNDENGYALQNTKVVCLTEKTKKLWSFEHRQHAHPGSIATFSDGYELPSPMCYDPKGESVDCETKFGLSQYAVKE